MQNQKKIPFFGYILQSQIKFCNILHREKISEIFQLINLHEFSQKHSTHIMNVVASFQHQYLLNKKMCFNKGLEF